MSVTRLSSVKDILFSHVVKSASELCLWTFGATSTHMWWWWWWWWWCWWWWWGNIAHTRRGQYKRFVKHSLFGWGETPFAWHIGRYLVYLKQTKMKDDECETVGGISCRGNQRAQRKPAPEPLFPSQTPHDLTWALNRAAAVESRRLRRLTARTVARHGIVP
jgi:hypothetical protein